MIHNITYNNEIYNYLNNYNYNEININEIKEIAISLGLTIDGIDNDEMYNRIERMILLRERLLNEQFKYENINSFKCIKPKLIINDNTEPLEISFWCVMRNKYIFNNIFSNFKFKSIYTYERLVNIEYIYNQFNNGIEIIRDKVKCSSFLYFGSTSINECKQFEIIFNYIYKNQLDNILFYQRLFKNYSTMFFKPILLLPLFMCSNKLSFKLYINYFNISSKDIQQSFNNQCNEYIINNYQHFKLYNYIRRNYTISNNIKLNISTFDIFNDSFKFKHLIKLCLIIESNKLNNCNNNNNNIINKNQIKDISKLYSNEQLNTSILNLLYSLNDNIGFGNNRDDLIINDNNNNNNIQHTHNNIIKKKIKKNILILIKMFYSISYKDKPMIYYYIFNDPNITKISKLNNDSSDLDYLKFNILKCNSRYEQYEYISSQLKKNKINEYNDIIHIDTTFLILTILKIDDLDLVKFIYNQFNNIFNRVIKLNTKYIIQSIKSNETLNWFYEYYKDEIFMNNNHYWIYINNERLIKEYEFKIKTLNRTLLVIGYHRYSLYNNRINQFELELLIRAFKDIYHNGINNSIYKIDSSFSIYSYSSLFELLIDHNKQDLLIEFFKYYNNVSNELNLHHLIPNRDFNSKLYKLCYWLYSNCIHDDIIIGNEFVKLQIQVSNNQILNLNLNILNYVSILYSIGLYDNIFKLNIFKLPRGNHYLSYIDNNLIDSPLELQKQYINHLSNEIKSNISSTISISYFKLLLLKTIHKSISVGGYPLIKFIFLNYPFIFNNNKDNLNQYDIEFYSLNIYLNSIKSNCIEIFEIIQNYNNYNHTNNNNNNNNNNKNNMVYQYFNLN